MKTISSDTISGGSILTHGSWIALNPKHSGYFDDREKSGIFLHQFDMENGSNRAQIPVDVDISRIEHAIALGRVVVLPSKDSPIPHHSMDKISNRTRVMLSEQEIEVDPRQILYSVNERELLSRTLPNIKNKNTLEQLFQLETNGDNSASKPRARVVDYLTSKIKEYAKQIAVVDVNKNEIVRDETIEVEGEKDIEFAKINEARSSTPSKSSARRRGRR